MNIKLIAQPLLVTERPAGEHLEAVDQAGNSQPQASILRVTIAKRIGGFEHHKQQREEKRLSDMRRSADPALPVAYNLLRQSELGGGLRPALLFIIEVG